MHTWIYSYDYRNLYSCHLYEIQYGKKSGEALKYSIDETFI